MKLASLREGGRDGTLIVVSRDLARAVRADGIAPTLQSALDDWSRAEPELRALADALEAGRAEGAFELRTETLASPLPRAYQFVDGSAYLAHVERVRKARGAEMPPSFLEDPLMYQAVSDGFLPPVGAIPVADEAFGIDFEAEVCVVTGDVPMGATPDEAGEAIVLVCLVNDVSLRNLIPGELAKGRIALGVTGSDVVREKIADWPVRIDALAPMGFGHADLVIAVPKAWVDVRDLGDLDAVAAQFRRTHGFRLRIATKYHRLVRAALKAAGVADYQIVDSQGATEGTVANLTAEAIADITSTGATLEANHLKIIGDVIHASQATLFRSRMATLGAAEEADLAAFLARLGVDAS